MYEIQDRGSPFKITAEHFYIKAIDIYIVDRSVHRSFATSMIMNAMYPFWFVGANTSFGNSPPMTISDI